MSDKFRLVMNAVDDDLLEEAFAPVKRKNLRPWISVAIAACLMLVLGANFAHSRNSAVTFADISNMGYVMKLPEDAERTAHYFDVLLGDALAERKNFIAENGAKYLELADIS